MNKPKIIGYWKEDKRAFSAQALEWTKNDPVYPSPEEFVDKSWRIKKENEYNSVVNFLCRIRLMTGSNCSIVTKSYKGYSECRFCGCENGSEEYQIFSKKKHLYTTPSGYLHYITAHSVKPPQDFIDFCVLVIGLIRCMKITG